MNAAAITARRARALSQALSLFGVRADQKPARTKLAVALVALAVAVETTPVPAGGPGVFTLVRPELAAALAPFGEESGVPGPVLTYVIEPVTGLGPVLPALSPLSEQHARLEAHLTARIAAVYDQLATSDPQKLALMFSHLLHMHRAFLVLEEAVALDRLQAAGKAAPAA
jgi:hypothetical protein